MMPMKRMQTTTKALLGAGHKASRRRKLRFDKPEVPMFPEVARASLIRWPTERQIMEVSKQLVKIGRMGLRSEASGDYFNSGDLAYQMQEIIRTTAELFHRGQRLRRKTRFDDSV
jgi:hypothetical protein